MSPPPSAPLPAPAGEAAKGSEAITLRYLDPRQLRFTRRGVTLELVIDGAAPVPRVGVVRIFPLSEPARYLSVRDEQNQEIGVIVEPSQLDPESRRVVGEELDRRYLVPVIHSFHSMKERFGTVDWEAETSRGRCRFTTRNLRENVIHPSANRYLLTDVDGNRYDIPDLAALPATSQMWLLKHL